jgi:hypothetical protein
MPVGLGPAFSGDRLFQFRRDSVAPIRCDETISTRREVLRKQRPPTIPSNQTTGLDHVRIGPEPHLLRISQACPYRHGNTGRKAMTEVVTALLIFVSVGIFLAHAFDAYRLR